MTNLVQSQEQENSISFLWKKGEQLNEIVHSLSLVYGGNALPESTVNRLILQWEADCINKYKWKKADLITEGQFCHVYKGLDSPNNRKVAVKVFQENFEHNSKEEVQMLKSLDHKNIVKMYDAGRSSHPDFPDRYVICMELCSGRNLSTILREEYTNGLNDQQFLLVTECLHESVKYLQSKSVVHKNINPTNICEHKDHFKLMGFSFATFVGKKKAWSQEQYAGPHKYASYWPPKFFEMYLKQDIGTATVSAKEYIDLWSIGVTLYEAATGRLAIKPLECDDPQQMIKKMNDAFEIMKPNVISMIEDPSNNSKKTNWNQHEKLPEDIAITKPLADLVKEMLSKLMTKNRTCSVKKFSKFYESMKRLLPFDGLGLSPIQEQRHYNIEDFQWDDKNPIFPYGRNRVLKGTHRNDPNMEVAVKEFKEKPIECEEMKMLLKLNHPNIVKAYAAGEALQGVSKGLYVIVMEYCNGTSLEALLKNDAFKNGLDDEHFLLLIRCLRNGFEYLRSKKILHRDFKALNICLHTQNNEKMFKLIDFGESKYVQEGDAVELSFYQMGTPYYWHPRLSAKALSNTGTVTRSAKVYVDLWAIAVTIFEAVTGRKPFQPKGLKKFAADVINELKKAYEMKEEGSIWMEQQEEGGIWQSHSALPQGISISPRIIDLVTPMLAGLLQKERENMWKETQFLEKCDEILRVSSLQEVESTL